MSSGDISSLYGVGFDASQVEPQADYEALPPGKYMVLVEKAEVKDTKAGDGKYIKLQLAVLDGEFKGRRLFDNINIVNPNSQCVEIGARSLSALCRAIGVMYLEDCSQFLNKSCIASVKVKADANEVRTYLRNEDAQSVQQSFQPPPAVYAQPPQYGGPVAQQAIPQPQQQPAPPWGQAQQTKTLPPPQTAAATASPPWKR